MLQIFDFAKKFIGAIHQYKDLKIECDLKTADKTLSFTYLGKLELKEEYYLQTQDDEYVVKEINASSDGFPEVVALLNLEELEGKAWNTFAATESTLKEAADMALAGTGWRVGTCDIEKRRSIALTNTDSLQVIGKLCTAWMCERMYDTKTKTVHFKEQFGEDKGVYFVRGLNLKKAKVSSDTYDYCTQIEPIGADSLRIDNDGKEYVENYQYTQKVKRILWIDESYTDPEALKEDATAKLRDLSRPKKTYSAEVYDLARQKPGYSVLSYNLGDTVLLLDDVTGIKDKQRIVKLTVYPDNREKDTCELSNTVLTFEELQQQLKDAADVVSNITTNDGTVKGSAVDKIVVEQIVDFEAKVAVISKGYFSELEADYLYIYGELGAVKATIGEIETTYLKATDADIKYAQIEEIKTQYATIDLANIAKGAIKTAMIGEGVVGTAQIADGSITDAKIVELTANKITAGELSVERLIIRGSEKSIVYALNNIDGALQAQSVDTLNGEVLTDRTITGDKVVAKSITAGEIASKTITANEILSGTITTAELAAACITADKIAAGDIVGTNGTIDLKAGTFNYAGKMVWDGRNLNIEADNMSIGGKPVASKEQVDEAAILLVSLSNQYVSIQTDYKGNYTEFPDCMTTATVYWGSVDVTNYVTFTVTKSEGIIGEWDAGTKTYKVTGLQEDSGWVEIQAVYLNTIRSTGRMVLTKQKDVSFAGDTMKLNTQVLELDDKYFTTPNTITAETSSRTGDNVEYAGIFTVEETSDGVSWNIMYRSDPAEKSMEYDLLDGLATGNGDLITTGDSLIIGLKRDISAVKISLHSEEGVLIDRQTIPVVLTAKSLTMEQVFNLLTNNGEAKGIYKVGDQLYISLDYARAGNLTLGGLDNRNGVLRIYDSKNVYTTLLDNRGLHTAGMTSVYNSGKWVDQKAGVISGGVFSGEAKEKELTGKLDLSAAYYAPNGGADYCAVLEAISTIYLKSRGFTAASFLGKNATFYGDIDANGTIYTNEIRSRNKSNLFMKSWDCGYGIIAKIAKYYADNTSAYYLWVKGENDDTLGLITIDNSDERKKKHIHDSTVDALSVINQIRHVEYDWKDNDGHVENGYIAQQLADVCPRMALHMEESDTWQFESSAILQYATKAIQELSTRVERLEKALKTAGISLEEV